MAGIICTRPVQFGVWGVGLDIDANSLQRLAIKTQTFAALGDENLYRVNAEMVAEIIDRMAPLAAEIRADIAQQPLLERSEA